MNIKPLHPIPFNKSNAKIYLEYFIFKQIKQEVKNAYYKLYLEINQKCRDHITTLILANGRYIKAYDKKNSVLNPYAIESMDRYYRDEARIDFQNNLLNSIKNRLLKGQGFDYTNDNLMIESMIYSNTWESKHFLFELLKLSTSLDKGIYLWEQEEMPYKKYKLIRNQITQIFKKHNLKIGYIIETTYYGQLRNAISHSEIVFNNENKEIILDNYKIGDNDNNLKTINYISWKKILLRTLFLSYYSLNFKTILKKNLGKIFNSKEFLIIHPLNRNSFTTCTLLFDQKANRFFFKINSS